MKIDTYIHGGSDDDVLWAALGPFLCDRKVLDECGSPIYSTPGVHWFVARDSGRVVGFASMRLTTKAIWYDYGYVVPGSRGHGVFTALARARDAEVARDPLPRRTAVREARWKHYKQRGWKVESRRGSWIYATKEAA
jgi:hypothetical protein